MPSKEGWGQPGSARKWHYFRSGVSLCEKWLFGGLVYPEEPCSLTGGPDGCVECERKREVERERATSPA